MVTTKDVARRCGYSVCTVSCALSGRGYLKEETKQKILGTAVELRHQPNTLAVNLKAGCHQALALALPSLTNICYTKLEQYLEACAAEEGYIIYLNNTEYNPEEEKQILENLTGVDITEVIIIPVTSQYDHIVNLAKCNTPYVYLSRSFEDDMEHYLRPDNEKAAYEAVSYMTKLGYKNTGGIFRSFDNLAHRDCYGGMAQAPKEHGLGCHPSHILSDIGPEDMGTTPGRVLQLLQRPGRPEAIFAYNDMTASNIYRICYILGLQIPDHLSVLGHDDCIMVNFVTPPPSTVSISVRKLAETAIGFIHDYLESGVRAELPMLEAPLIIRNSVRNLNPD